MLLPRLLRSRRVIALLPLSLSSVLGYVAWRACRQLELVPRSLVMRGVDAYLKARTIRHSVDTLAQLLLC
jgi:hypothetical protein